MWKKTTYIGGGGHNFMPLQQGEGVLMILNIVGFSQKLVKYGFIILRPLYNGGLYVKLHLDYMWIPLRGFVEFVLKSQNLGLFSSSWSINAMTNRKCSQLFLFQVMINFLSVTKAVFICIAVFSLRSPLKITFGQTVKNVSGKKCIQNYTHKDMTWQRDEACSLLMFCSYPKCDHNSFWLI